MILDSESKNTPCTKFEEDQANILAMATPEINENCHYVQNDSHMCKIKLKKFHFDIFWCYGVIEESLSGGRIHPPPPPGEIGLTHVFV